MRIEVIDTLTPRNRAEVKAVTATNTPNRKCFFEDLLYPRS
jgi:hypothetical protein